MNSKRGQWASNLGFILAAAGSAVGLGNIWKFPGKIAAYGGGAFLLLYVLIVALIGLPVMLAELSIGRATQKNVVGAFHSLNRRWTFCGGLGVVTLFVILSYYCIVGGWVTKYVFVYLTGADFPATAAPFQDFFVQFISAPVEPLIWGALFFGLCIFVVVRGVSSGIEKFSKFLMPCLFLLLIAIVFRAVTLPGAWEGVKYLFEIRPEAINGDTLVAALGQAFFSLSVGMGIMVTYGSYVSKKENLLRSAGMICILDTLVAVLAALTSAISILESCTAFLNEELHWSRLKSTLLLAAPMSLLSIGYSLSQSAERSLNLPWLDWKHGLQWLPMNAVMEKFTDNLMIPLGALLFCVFVGWIWGSQKAAKEISGEAQKPFKLKKYWSFTVRYIAPAVILVILYFTLIQGQGLS